MEQMTEEELNNSIFKFISNEKTNGNTLPVKDIAELWETENNTTPLKDPAGTYKKLAELYQDEKDELLKVALLRNKAFITNTKNYLKRKKDTDKNKYYYCNVFQQDNNKDKKPTQIKFPRGTLSYIGAMTHRGKTTALISITLDALLSGQKVYFITTEETPDQIFDRMIKAILYKTFCKNTNIFSYNNVHNNYYLTEIENENLQERIDAFLLKYENELINNNPEEIKTLKDSILNSYNLLNNYIETGLFTLIDHTQQRNFEQLTNAIEIIDNKSLVLLDYIQHVKNPANRGSDNRQVIIQNQSQTLSDIAGHKELILIAGGQFNRNGKKAESENDKYKCDFLDPTLFRESGDIEQDAHLIIGIGQQLHQEENSLGENVSRFYEVLKQRGNPADTKQYKIIDNSAFSLFECNIKESVNGNKYLIPFTKNEETKTNKPTSNNRKTANVLETH